MKSSSFLFLFFVVLLSLQKTFAVGSGITYNGRLLDPSGNAVTSSNVQFRIQIRTPGNENCLMYEEIQSKDMTNSDGVFSITINDGSGSRTDSTGFGLDQLFANRGSFNFPAGYCVTGTVYNTTPTDGRKLQVYFNDGSFATGQWEPTPSMAINFIPMAIESQQVGGYKKEQLLKIADGVSTTGTELDTTKWTNLLALINGTSTAYTKPTDQVTQLYGATVPTPANGQSIRWNSALNAGAGGWENFTAGAASAVTTVSSANADIAVTNGSTTPQLTLNSGTAANQIVKLDGTAKLPAVDGSALTNVNASKVGGTSVSLASLTNGQVLKYNGTNWVNAADSDTLGGLSCSNGRVAYYTAGSWACLEVTSISTINTIVSRDGTGESVFGSINTGTLKINDGATGTISLTTPVAVTSYSMRLPATVGSAGQVLTTDGGSPAQLSWSSASSQWTTTGSDIYYNTGNVGIGVNPPTDKLEVSGNIKLSSGANRTISVGGVTSGTGNNLNITAGGNTAGYGGSLILSGGQGYFGASSILNLGSSGFNGGSVTLQAGTSDTNGTAGNVNIIGGTNGANNIGGKVIIKGGQGGSSNQVGGQVLMYGGTPGGSNTTYGDVILAHDGTAARGKVGVGTTAPSVPFHLKATGSPYNTGLFENGCSGCTVDFRIYNNISANGSVSALYLSNNYGSGEQYYGAVKGIRTTNMEGALTLSATNAAGSLVEGLRVNSSANIGIGTTNPVEKLEVNGAIKIGTTTSSNAGTIRWDGTNFQGYNGASWFNFVPQSPTPGTCDTTQSFSSAGTFAYTVPSSFGTLTVRVWGAGGGGGSAYSGTSVGGGSIGGTSSVNSLGLVATGGVGGGASQASTVAGASGGTATGGTVNSNGTASAAVTASGPTSGGSAPNGGGSGGAAQPVNNSGQSGVAPGGGGSAAVYGATASASGGGSGAYVEKTFTPLDIAPGTNVSDIVVGSGGSGSCNGVCSGVGAVGRVTITCASAGSTPANDRAVVFWNSGKHDSVTNFVYNASGQLGVGTINPTQRLQVGESADGSVALANAWNTFSDKRLKKDFQRIPAACEKLDQLGGYYYYWRSEKDPSRQVGVIAQEVEQVFPELVKTSESGIKSVDYSKFSAILIEANKELYQRSKDQSADIEKLKDENQKLKDRLERLEKAILNK